MNIGDLLLPAAAVPYRYILLFRCCEFVSPLTLFFVGVSLFCSLEGLFFWLSSDCVCLGGVADYTINNVVSN